MIYLTMDAVGLTDEDEAQIREYLEKPAHARTTDDLVPDDDYSG
ncbi:hypothetical protein [Natronomonas salina]|nr:hypothetical protein [Natronomonas salina]